MDDAPKPRVSETSRQTILAAAAHGNGPALEFLKAFTARAHWLDDLADGDKCDVGARPDPETIARHEFSWLLCLTGNAFFVANRAALVPVMALALNAWVDSGRAEFTKHRQCDVIKGLYHEVVWMTALLTGGWEALRMASSVFRAYDIEPEKKGGTDGLPGQ